jgi:uncharacterized protein (DUF58 family)
MTIPSKNFGLLLLISLGFLYLGMSSPLALTAFKVILGVLVAGALVDLALSARESGPEIERDAPDIWAVDFTGTYTVTIRNTLSRPIRGVFDENSYTHLRKTFPEQRFELTRGAARRFEVKFTALVRGALDPGPIFARYTSKFGLWQIARRRHPEGRIKVFPHISDYLALNPFHHRLRVYMRGQHTIRMLGEGTDFDSLRDYLPDDAYSKINWKATARLNRPIVSEYRAERDREVIAVLDGGRQMFTGIEGKSRFDRCLDAIAQLSYALKLENDRMGVALFDREVRFYRQPTRQPDVLADLFPFYPQHVESDFPRLLAFLQRNHPKRAVLFLFTELTDSITCRKALNTLSVLARRHQIVVIMMDDPEMYSTAVAPMTREEHFLLHAAAVAYLKEKKAFCERLRRSGVDVVRTYASRLSADVINKYLELKARNLA